MAQTKRKRRRKHRGTQSGRIDTRGGRGRPRSRQEARARARSQMGQKRAERPPTWRSAINRAALFAAILFALFVLLMKQPVVPTIGLTIVMFGLYIPLGYVVDRFFYNRRQAQKQRQAGKAKS
jgi:hypothetical protein